VSRLLFCFLFGDFRVGVRDRTGTRGVVKIINADVEYRR